MRSAFELLPTLGTDPVFVAADYDFTLVEEAPTPAEAMLSAERRAVFVNLGVRDRFAIVTGRSEESAQAATGLTAGLWVFGGGLMVVAPGTRWVHPEHDPTALAAVRVGLCVALQSCPNAWVEEVGGMSITVHWRQTPAALHSAVEEVVRRVVGATKLRLIMDAERFGAMVEQPIDWTKGDGLQMLLGLVGWSGKVVALGDTLADDPMFLVAQQSGGFGVRVGERESTVAHARLSGPSEVYTFLKALSGRGE